MNKEAVYWIESLGLEEHPEGGYYRETYRSCEQIAPGALPRRYAGGSRAFATAIYFLLADDDFSALHRLRSDEIWYFHAGAPLTIHIIDKGGNYSSQRLGCGVKAGFEPQAVIIAGNWFGASLDRKGTFALVSCMVAPGFDFRDFEMGDREELLRTYPRHSAVIERLTRVKG